MAERIAIASSDGSNIDLHFAKAASFYIYEIFAGKYEYIEYRKLDAANRHDEIEFERTLKALEDCKAIIVAQIGRGALAFVNSKGIRVFEAPYPIQMVLERFIDKNILNN
ncbi:MAG: Dinitrogenase iron-molybdenum cofactor biosynthesis protein [Eubacterium sp.]|jgi:predicted Fe-Mo cluster-binding NifX family protein|nr:Dinitrogenase iron-molybdenum cofactor biosynthesis protein [Eubacterium sp.]